MQKTRKIAGNCCCLVPVVLLVALVAAAIGFTLVGYGGLTGISHNRWHHRSSDAYAEGFAHGKTLGAAAAVRGEIALNTRDVDGVARREADTLHIANDRRQWERGFRSGFARGYDDNARRSFQ